MARLFAALLFLAGLSAPCCLLKADVFSLWGALQGGGRGASWPGGAAAEVLNPKKLWSEPVVVNGRELSLGIALADSSFESCVFELRSAYPKALYAANADSLLMETPTAKGSRLRVFLVAMPGIYPVIQFSMEVPDPLPANPAWPGDMPLPPSSKALTVMQFPKRGSTYGLYSSGLEPEQALEEMRKGLRASGWRPVGGDYGMANVGSGEVYLKDRPMAITIVGASSGSDGQTRGSVYTRALSTK